MDELFRIVFGAFPRRPEASSTEDEDGGEAWGPHRPRAGGQDASIVGSLIIVPNVGGGEFPKAESGQKHYPPRRGLL